MSFAAKFGPKGNSGSFVAQIIRGKALVYHLIFPLQQGKAWYIFEVEAAKHKGFKEVLGKPVALTLSDYGTVLHSGWGEGPDETLKAELREKYGLYED